MKKTLAVLLTVLMLFSLTACGKKEAPATPVTGGWTAVEGAAVSDEAQTAFDKAMEGLVGVGYEPVALLARQVVSGTNYCYLCQATVVVPNAQPYYALVYVYADLQGKAEVKKIVALDMGDIAETGTVQEADASSGALMGGWRVDRESAVDLEGALVHLGSQVVAGKNHCVLCEGNELVFVYENLEGKTEVTKRVPIDVAALWQ